MKAKKLSELLKESLEKQQNQPKRLKSSKMIENNEAERFERRKQDFKNKKNISDKLALVEKNLTEKENSTTNIKSYSIDNLKIIGITGSFGKTSTAVLIHRYLQAIGKKSVLYSSAYIDSPATWIGRQNSYTSVIKTQDEFLNMVEECLVYKADYLIVECWEDSIARGVFDNIKFKLKILTSFNDNLMKNIYQNKDTYFNNKLKFFKDDENCTVLMNLRSNDNPAFRYQDFIKNISNKKYYFNSQPNMSSKLKKLHIKTDYSLEYPYYNFLESSYFTIVSDSYDPQTYLSKLTGWNVDNVLCSFAALDILRELDLETFREFIENDDLYITGRNQIIDWKGRKVVIDYDIINALEVCSDAKTDNKDLPADILAELNARSFKPFEINNIRCMISPRSEFVSTNKYKDNYLKNIARTEIVRADRRFSSDEALSDEDAQQYNELADQIIINPLNIGSGNYQDIVNCMKQKITVPVVDYKSRFQAILNTLMESQKGDVIIVAGRGNINSNIIEYDKVEFGTDLDLVNKAIAILNNVM